jgi:hypothetical protein
MAIKINANMSAVAHHIVDGMVTFPYAIDAHSAVSRFPEEWSHEPWPESDRAAAREAAGEPAVELTPEEQAALDEHTRAVAEANERLQKFREEQAEKKKIDDQIAADEALVNSPPPQPAPRRPFGRKGPPTPAEIAAQKKRDEKKVEDDRLVAEKAEHDRLANARITT